MGGVVGVEELRNWENGATVAPLLNYLESLVLCSGRDSVTGLQDRVSEAVHCSGKKAHENWVSSMRAVPPCHI